MNSCTEVNAGRDSLSKWLLLRFVVDATSTQTSAKSFFKGSGKEDHSSASSSHTLAVKVAIPSLQSAKEEQETDDSRHGVEFRGSIRRLSVENCS